MSPGQLLGFAKKKTYEKIYNLDDSSPTTQRDNRTCIITYRDNTQLKELAKMHIFPIQNA